MPRLLPGRPSRVQPLHLPDSSVKQSQHCRGFASRRGGADGRRRDAGHDFRLERRTAVAVLQAATRI